MAQRAQMPAALPVESRNARRHRLLECVPPEARFKFRKPLGTHGFHVLPVGRAVVGVLLVAAAVLPAFTGRLARSDCFKDLLAAHEGVSAEPSVQYAQVSHSSFFRSGGVNVESVAARVNLAERRDDDRAFAERIAKIILVSDKKASGMSAIHVTLVYGYDLGISSAARPKRYQFAPQSPASADSAATSGGAK